ncbi:Cilia- and flagella-associated protein 43 [Cichlidogyrus casuarinus]|uniref:Cilia- and flagella-associated protein 43 n=1 Tax=Cichlidogyrus casuarinus TaxID=1844966 RepID=A0ABD2QJM0_9PLAT
MTFVCTNLAKYLIPITSYLHDQLDLSSREKQIEQIVLMKSIVHQLKEKFNSIWKQLYGRKEQDLARIRERQMKVASIVDDLKFFWKDENKVKMMVFGTTNCDKIMQLVEFNSKEQPEKLLQVKDEEIKVKKYYTAEQLAEMNAKKKEEEERLRLQALDNWRERGLEDMMGGVLEVRREDELKKDITKPVFIQLNKPENEWTDEENVEYNEYLEKCRLWEEERDKHKKFLEAEAKRILQTIEDIKGKFNELFLDLFNQWIQYHSAILHEEFKIERLQRNLLNLELVRFKIYLITDRKSKARERVLKAGEIQREARQLLDKVQEDYDILVAEDKLLEKSFKKDFSDVTPHILDFLSKSLKKRPKRLFGMKGIVPKAHTAKSSEQGEDDTKSVVSVVEDRNRDEIVLSIMENPYIDISVSNLLSENLRKQQLDSALKELDHENNYKTELSSMDPKLWSRFCEYRKRKILLEADIKKMALTLAEMQSFINQQTENGRKLNGVMTSLDKEFNEAREMEDRLETDLELHILVKQGLLEVDPRTFDSCIPECDGAVLVKRTEIEDLNAKIIELGDVKLDHLSKKKELNRKFNALEWELKNMLMQYQDLRTKKSDIQHFRITTEILKV